jgi:hypothetical protein
MASSASFTQFLVAIVGVTNFANGGVAFFSHHADFLRR